MPREHSRLISRLSSGPGPPIHLKPAAVHHLAELAAVGRLSCTALVGGENLLGAMLSASSPRYGQASQPLIAAGSAGPFGFPSPAVHWILL